MAKLHIVSVGGTGHKVLVSAIHLAACGAFRSRNTNQVTEINVIGIDADNDNGSLAIAKNTFLSYKKLHKAVHRDDSGLVDIYTVVPSSEIHINLFQEGNTTLSETFGFDPTKAIPGSELIRFLYIKDEITTPFKEGFYGHTSVGAVIVRDVLRRSNEWTKFLSKVNTNDLVVVVGSIFGGTGASCIPVVLEELKEKKRSGTGLATIILTPYFQALGELNKDEALQPDSENFDIKAKAALNYYNIERKLDATHALYVIGEPHTNYSYELASRGGEKQRNKAHPIELFAATAILDFVQHDTDRRQGKVYVAGRAFTNGNYCYTWRMLQNVDKDLHVLVQTFVKTAIFYNKVLYPQLLHDSSAGIWEDFYYDGESSLQKKKDENNNFVYENIHEYFSLFVEWVLEIHQRNIKDLDPETKKLKKEINDRVRLFNVEFSALFSPKGEYSSGKVKNFEKLIYREEGMTTERILAELNYNPPKTGKGFPALFAVIKDLLEEKKPLPRHPKLPPENEMKSIAYLSQENDSEYGAIFNEDSFWIASNKPKILVDIADGLPNKVSHSFTMNDLSIPSPWSIFIMNEMSLRQGDKFKALNDNAYNQWCGLIALLVLRRLNRYEQGHELKVHHLTLDANDRFLSTIKDLSPPKGHIFGTIDPDWLNCAAVKLGKYTIAFLAHNTLVCPAFSIDKETATKLHVFAPTIVGSNGEFLKPEGYFADKSSSDNQKSKYALSLVLGRLLQEMPNQVAAEGEMSMTGLVKKYIDALGDVDVQDNVLLPSLPREEDIIINNVFDVFEQLCIREGTADRELPFILKGTLPGKEVAIISLQVNGMSETERTTAYITPTLVYSEIRMDNIRNYCKNEKDGRDERDGIELVYDQDLLCNSMVIRAKEQGSENAFYSLPALPGASIPDYEVVWPVSEKLLMLYTPEQLNKMLSIQREKDSVSVTLNLDVMGKMRKHSVTKEYRVKNIGDDDRRVEDTGVCSIFEARRLPLWAVWPYAKVSNNQSASAWQRYTFFCVDHIYNDAPVFAIKPFFPEGTGGLETSKLSAINVNGREFFYRRCKALPGALKIFEQIGIGGAQEYRGTVFLASPQPPKKEGPRTAIWNVGVDFGTTSTSIYYSTGTQEPDFLQLLTGYHWRAGKNDEPEIVGKLESSLEILCNSGDEDFLDKYFIDKQCLSQKGYTTTFEELNAKDDEDETLFDSGRIFWHNYKNFKDVNAVLGRREHLKSGIKWESNKKWALRYLNQMLTQVSYRAIEEGASEIRWFFSYPTAFSSEDRDIFKARLVTLIAMLKKETAIKHEFDGESNLLTESVAAALFFRKKHPDYVTFLCLDIGGGTSDISIWANKELVFQTSAKFASREMFVEPLQKLFLTRPTVMEKVCTSDVTDGIHTMLRYDGKDADKESIPFLIETVLFEYLESFKNRLEGLPPEDRQAYRHFKYLVYTAYAGLIFYLVNIIAGLLDDIKARLSNDDSQIVLGLSGKGSRLTEWIPSRWYRSVYKTAEDFIKEKTGYDITFEVPPFQADAAKTETAYGLICNPINQNGKRKFCVGCGYNRSKDFHGLLY